ARPPPPRPPMGNRGIYETFDAALARFRLMPEQLCDNPFIVEFIGRHSLKRAEAGWVWKFDSGAMGSRRFGDPLREVSPCGRSPWSGRCACSSTVGCATSQLREAAESGNNIVDVAGTK